MVLLCAYRSITFSTEKVKEMRRILLDGEKQLN